MSFCTKYSMLQWPEYMDEERIYEQIYNVACLLPREDITINAHCKQINPKSGSPVELAFLRSYDVLMKRGNIVYVSIMTIDLSEVRSFDIRTILGTLEREGLENLLASMQASDKKEKETNPRIRNPQIIDNHLIIPAVK